MTTAFVLSGGASHGAVQVGMLRALADHGVRPDLVFGASAGALNAAPMISNFYTLDDYSSALEAFKAGTGRKLQIRPNSTESGSLL